MRSSQLVPVRARVDPELVSVIIPCRDAAGTLGEQLAALAGQTYRGAWEVVLVDNGSSDASTDVARSWAARLPSLRVLSTAEPGVSNVRNFGAEHALGDLLAFCDADDVVTPEWLDALVRVARDADIVAGQLDDTTLNSARSVAWRGRLPVGEPLRTFGHRPFAPGGNCCVWRDVFEALGGWDASYVAGSDDVDFSWRAQRRGLVVAFAPDAVLRYRYRDTLRGLCKQYYRYGLSEALLYRRFRDELPAYRWRDVLRVWRGLLRGPRGRAAVGPWLRAVSYHLGHLRGSVRQRVLLP